MNSVIIFDVPNAASSRVRERMRAEGYYTSWSVTNADGQRKIYSLPSNTVWKPNTESDKALNDIKRIVEQVKLEVPGTELLRCIVLNSTPWNGIVGTPL